MHAMKRSCIREPSCAESLAPYAPAVGQELGTLGILSACKFSNIATFSATRIGFQVAAVCVHRDCLRIALVPIAKTDLIMSQFISGGTRTISFINIKLIA